MSKIIKSVLINIFGFITDTISMYILGNNFDYTLTKQIYISSLLRIIVLYIGHINYTYKDTLMSKRKLAIRFFVWEFISMFIVNQLVIYINRVILNYLRDHVNDLKLYKILLEKIDDKYEFKTRVNILLKQTIIILFYFIVDIRIYKKIFY